MNAAAPPIAWPRKTGEFQDATLDSTRWNDFAFRDGDIVVATFPKSGTTLTQQIVSQLVLDADPSVFGQAISPWIDCRMAPQALDEAAAQTHRRFLKTHLPLGSLVFSPRAKYLFIARDPRDVAWSLHNHLTGGTEAADAHVKAQAAEWGLPPVDPDVRRYYHDFLDGSQQSPPFWPFIQGWWDARALPNVFALHYADLIADMAGQVRRIAAFLDIPLDDVRLTIVLAHCTISHMRKVAADDPFLNMIFKRGAETFINKGTNGRWRDVLNRDEIDKADLIAERELTPDCAAWLRNGGARA